MEDNKLIYKAIIALMLICGFHTVNAQQNEKFFKIEFIKYPFGNNGKVVPIDESKVKLSFPGFNREQIAHAVFEYIKTYPENVFVRQTFGTLGTTVIYRDFREICKIQDCKADLTALSFFNIIILDNELEFTFFNNTKIYSSMYDVGYYIAPNHAITTADGKPYNEIQYAYPNNTTYMKTSKFEKQKITYNYLAYPEAVFDFEGNVVNAKTKEAVESYYDWAFLEFRNYMISKLKK